MYLLESYVFLKNYMGISMKNAQSADFCAYRIGVITNFAVIPNVVIKRVHCMYQCLRVYCDNCTFLEEEV